MSTTNDNDGGDIEIVSVETKTVAYVRKTCGVSPNEISAAMGEGFGELMGALGQAGVAPVGAPMAAYHDYGGEETTFDVCMPISPDAAEKVKGARVAETVGGRSLRTLHKGPYAALKSTYDRFWSELGARKLTPRGPSYEVYLNDPGVTPEADLLTEIHIPVE